MLEVHPISTVHILPTDADDNQIKWHHDSERHEWRSAWNACLSSLLSYHLDSAPKSLPNGSEKQHGSSVRRIGQEWSTSTSAGARTAGGPAPPAFWTAGAAAAAGTARCWAAAGCPGWCRMTRWWPTRSKRRSLGVSKPKESSTRSAGMATVTPNMNWKLREWSKLASAEFLSMNYHPIGKKQWLESPKMLLTQPSWQSWQFWY